MTSSSLHPSISSVFADIDDPRVIARSSHLLIDVLTIAVCAILCGAEGWADMELFGKSKEDWLRTFLKLPNGIPSHDTFARIFAAIDPDQFRECFIRWTQSLMDIDEDLIAIDGKTLRGSRDKGKSAIHIVSAWASANSLVLGQYRVDEKSNEITAIPELLRILHIKGALITIDAMGCQKDIAEQIVDAGADYLLAVKGNQRKLLNVLRAARMQAWQRDQDEDGEHKPHIERESGHGRESVRYCVATSVGEYAKTLMKQGDEQALEELAEVRQVWPGLATMISVYSNQDVSRESGSGFEMRHYISNRDSDNAEEMLSNVRRHWEIENKLHWVLDVQFNEDQSRIRSKNSAENMAILRHLTLNILKRDKSVKRGVKAKRKLAGWDHAYLAQLLGLK